MRCLIKTRERGVGAIYGQSSLISYRFDNENGASPWRWWFTSDLKTALAWWYLCAMQIRSAPFGNRVASLEKICLFLSFPLPISIPSLQCLAPRHTTPLSCPPSSCSLSRFSITLVRISTLRRLVQLHTTHTHTHTSLLHRKFYPY